jgi:CBS domain-containing protein
MNTVGKVLKPRGKIVWSVTPSDSVMTVLRMMIEKDVGAILVMEGEEIGGIISERDIARKITYLQKSPIEIQAKEIMSTPVFTIEADQTIETARALMTAHRIRHLPVLQDEKVVGVLSNRDVVSEIIYIQRQTIDFYKDIALDD